MKKFKFSLNSVHKFKNQILDSLKNEHSFLLVGIIKQEKIIDELENKRKILNEEFNRKNKSGNTILEISNYKRYLRILDNKIKQEYAIMERLKEEEVEKRAEVVEAKKETASLDILKQKKMEEYRVEEQKASELQIDEFVSNKLFSEKINSSNY